MRFRARKTPTERGESIWDQTRKKVTTGADWSGKTSRLVVGHSPGKSTERGGKNTVEITTKLGQKKRSQPTPTVS